MTKKRLIETHLGAKESNEIKKQIKDLANVGEQVVLIFPDKKVREGFVKVFIRLGFQKNLDYTLESDDQLDVKARKIVQKNVVDSLARALEKYESGIALDPRTVATKPSLWKKKKESRTHDAPKLSETFRFRPRTAIDDERDDELERNGAVEELAGGRAYGQGDDKFDPEQLRIGTEHEMEHTDDPNVAKQTAKDHLITDPKYYQKLKKIEKEGPEFDMLMATGEEERPDVKGFVELDEEQWESFMEMIGEMDEGD